MVGCATAERPEGTRAPVVICATASQYECNSTTHSGKNVRFVRFYPPPLPITIRRKTPFLCLRRLALVAGGQGLALPDRCTEVLYHTSILAGGRLGRGCIPRWGRVSGYLWGVTLGCSACYSGQPQIWVAPGRGVRSKMGVSFWLSLESYTGFRNQPLWSPPNLDHTRQGCIQDSWRASRTILSATRGAGETPAIPGGYAIISDAPLSQGVFQIIGEICLTIGGFNQVDGYGLT